MIACLHPSEKYIDENISTLMYASKAALIANTPVRNDDPKTK
jgi:kinesin family protein 4/21/27